MSRNNQHRHQGGNSQASKQPSQDDAFNREASEDDSADERVVRAGADEAREDRGVVEDADRAGLGDLMSAEDYEALVRNEFEQTALPKPPAMPGWHLCWLTTTSQYDNIAKRQRVGYRPVRASEMPGFDPSNGQSLERFEGFITCNEMVLHKIPEAYFQQMMKYFHHTKPREDEQGTLRTIRDRMEQEQDSAGRDLGELLGSGYLDMEASAKRTKREPSFNS